MTTSTQIDVTEKIVHIYSERRERQIPVLIRYVVDEQGGCTIYTLEEVDELE